MAMAAQLTAQLTAAMGRFWLRRPPPGPRSPDRAAAQSAGWTAGVAGSAGAGGDL